MANGTKNSGNNPRVRDEVTNGTVVESNPLDSKVQVDPDATPIPTETEKSGKVGSKGWSAEELKNPLVQEAAQAQAKTAPDDTKKEMPALNADGSQKTPAAGPPPLPPKQAPAQRLPAPPSAIMSPADRTAAAMSPQGQAKPVKTPAAPMARGVTQAPPDAETIRSANSPGAIPPEEIDSLQKGYAAAKPKPFTPGLEATNPAIQILPVAVEEVASPEVLASRREQNIEGDAAAMGRQIQKLRGEVTDLEEALRYRAEERDTALNQRDAALLQVVERDRQLAESQDEAKQLRKDLINNGVIKKEYEDTKRVNSDLKEENKSLRKVANGTNPQATAEVTRLQKEVRQGEGRISALVKQNKADLEARQKAEEKAKQLEQKVAELQKLTPQQLTNELAEGVWQGKKKLEDAKVPLNGGRFSASDPKAAIQSFLLLFELCLKALFAERQARTNAGTAHEEQVNVLKERVKVAEQQRDEFEQLLGTVSQEKQDLQTALDTANRQLNILDNNIIGLNGDNARLEGEKVAQAERIAQLEAADAEKARIIGEQNATIQQRDARVAELDETVKALGKELENTQNELQNIVDNAEPNKNEIARTVKEGAEILALLKSFVGDEKYDSLVIMREFVDGNGELQKQVDIFATIKQIATVISEKYNGLREKLEDAESRLEAGARKLNEMRKPALAPAATPQGVVVEGEVARRLQEATDLAKKWKDSHDQLAIDFDNYKAKSEDELKWAREANDRDNIRKAFRKQCAILGLTERQNKIWMDIADAMASAPDKQVEELDLAVRAFMEEYPTATARADEAEQAKAQAEAERDAANQRAETAEQQLADLRQQLVVVPAMATEPEAPATADLERRVTELEQQLADAQAQAEAANLRAVEAEAKREAAEKEVARAAGGEESAHLGAQVSVAKAETDLEHNAQLARAAVDAKKAADERALAAEAKVAELATQVEEQAATISELTTNNTAANEAKAMAEELYEAATDLNAEANGKVDQLTTQVEEQVATISQLTADNTAANEAKAKAEAEVKRLEGELETAKARPAVAVLPVLEADVGATDKKADGEAGGGHKFTTKAQAEVDFAALESDLQGTRTALDAANTAKAQADADVVAMTANRDVWKEWGENENKKVNRLTAELAAAKEQAEADVAAVRRELYAARNAPPADDNRLSAQEAQRLQGEVERLETEARRLQDELDTVNAANDEIAAAYQAAEEERLMHNAEAVRAAAAANVNQSTPSGNTASTRTPPAAPPAQQPPAPVVVHNEQPPRRSGWMWPILAIILLALIGGGIWFFQNSGVEIYRDGVVKGVEVLKDGITEGKECCEGKNCVCPPAQPQPTSAPAEQSASKPAVNKPHKPAPVADDDCEGCDEGAIAICMDGGRHTRAECEKKLGVK